MKLENKLGFILNYSPFLIASFILFLYYLPELINPIFPEDSGIRLLFAKHVILHAENRVWLPFLQLHIFLLYLVKSPIYLYKLIPMIYFFTLIFILNKLSLRTIGNGILEKLFTTLLLLSLVTNSLLLYLGSNLQQEIIVFALFYLLIYLYYFRKRLGISFHILSGLAMLTREYFWVYYIALGIVSFLKNHSLPKKNIIVYSLYGFIPILWILTTKQPIFLGVMGINSNNFVLNYKLIIDEINKLIITFSLNSLFPIMTTIILVLFVICICRKLHIIKYLSTNFAEYTLFSTFSIFGIYVFVIFRYPLQIISFNARNVFPLILHLPFWFLLCYQEVSNLPRVFKITLILLLVFGMGTLVNKRPHLNNFIVRESSFYSKISEGVAFYKKTHRNKSPKIGVVEVAFWKYYIPYISAALLYEDKRFITSTYDSCFNYEIIITKSGFSSDNFYKHKTINIGSANIEMWFNSYK